MEEGRVKDAVCKKQEDTGRSESGAAGASLPAPLFVYMKFIYR